MPASRQDVNWEDLRLVHAVACDGSFVHAAAKLGMDASTVARRVQRTEAALGVKLFDRHAHGMRLTPAGQRMYDCTRQIDVISDSIMGELQGADAEICGVVKFAGAEQISQDWILPALTAFKARYPEITVELVPARSNLDFLGREADIACTTVEPTQPQLVLRKLPSVPVALYAARGAVADAAGHRDLGGVDFVEYTPYRGNACLAAWVDQTFCQKQVKLRTANSALYSRAIYDGLGIGFLPCAAVRAGRLLKVEGGSGFDIDQWLVSHEETNKARRVRALLDFLWDRARCNAPGLALRVLATQEAA